MSAVAVAAAGSVVEVLTVDAGQVHARVTVGPGDPVFAGHYPGFPVLPGVYLIEFADRAARSWLAASAGAAGPAVRLSAVDSCRFRGPVYPGEEIEIRVTGEPDLRCSAALSTPAGPAADIRLRYRHGDT